jgi:hypothetical protein
VDDPNEFVFKGDLVNARGCRSHYSSSDLQSFEARQPNITSQSKRMTAT